MKCLKVDGLNVEIHDSRAAMGKAAAQAVSDRIRTLLLHQEEVNIIFASAPSQNEFLEELQADWEIPWRRVNAFHMDEYVGLPKAAPQGFGNFIRAGLWDHVALKSMHLIDGNSADRQAECLRYAELLRMHPVDIVCCGIGENGHLAFNDPPVADFQDPQAVKVVELDQVCRQQQVNDGCFATLDDVPTHALTLTIPALMAGKYLYGVIPGDTKAEAVRRALTDEISERCPATVLRRHPAATIFLDGDSAGKLS